jgi:hypothetical protein
MAESIVLVIANKKDIARSGLDGTILFPDCTMSIEHRFENEVTEHPIDGKANVSDHVVNKNQTISISGIYNTFNIVQYTGDAVGAQNRVARAYAQLLRLRNDKVRFSIVSRYDTYNNCVIKSLTIPIAPDNGNSLIFNMEVVQVRVSDNIQSVQLIQVENLNESMLDNAAFKKKLGTKQKDRVSTDAAVNRLDAIENGGSV